MRALFSTKLTFLMTNENSTRLRSNTDTSVLLNTYITYLRTLPSEESLFRSDRQISSYKKQSQVVIITSTVKQQQQN